MNDTSHVKDVETFIEDVMEKRRVALYTDGGRDWLSSSVTIIRFIRLSIAA